MKFETDLKLIQDFYTQHRYMIAEEKDFDVPPNRLKILEGMGLVRLSASSLSGGGTVELTPEGNAYFVNKKLNRIKFWKEFFTNFISGFVCGVAVTIVGELLIRWLLV